MRVLCRRRCVCCGGIFDAGSIEVIKQALNDRRLYMLFLMHPDRPHSSRNCSRLCNVQAHSEGKTQFYKLWELEAVCTAVLHEVESEAQSARVEMRPRGIRLRISRRSAVNLLTCNFFGSLAPGPCIQIKQQQVAELLTRSKC
jgi:hypothetical protein